MYSLGRLPVLFTKMAFFNDHSEIAHVIRATHIVCGYESFQLCGGQDCGYRDLGHSHCISVLTFFIVAKLLLYTSHQ